MNSRFPEVEGLELSVKEGVAEVLLARSQRQNALTRNMIVGLWDLLLSLDADETVRVIIVGGVGTVFSAGVDLSGAHAFSESPVAYRHRADLLKTPVVGALNGSAVGLGLSLALQWDIRFVSEDSKYGFVFTQRGLLPEMGAAWMLPRMVGRSTASELLLSGRTFTGEEAVRMGLASKALPRTAVLDYARSFAQDLAVKTSPVMVSATKQMLRKFLEISDFSEALKIDEECYAWVRSRSESAEGVSSFLDKRLPQWGSAKTDDLPEVLNPEWSA